MELTKRQEEFVRSLLDLYGELQEPFHYSELADRLGVSRFTAYDMLRVLEEKGIVTSQYQLDEERSGPGRSTVVYQPTPRARRILADVFESSTGEGWETIREKLLEHMQRGELGDVGLVREMLARTPPDEPDTLRYCIEVMTVVALNLRRQPDGPRLCGLAHRLLAHKTQQSPRTGLSLLGGFALGALALDAYASETYASESNEAWEQEWLEHIWHYQGLILDMEPATCQRLAGRLRDVFTPFNDS
ncbi:MAG TPA: helix-turn-helix domain-containing protein [Candidatus Sulfomarinibacteraceae bacterium]|nr:helix-turn-helix domain-containing protein [Candidatus Sulfomarinibacteraceae bacterium]